MTKACNWHNGECSPALTPDRDIKVAAFAIRFPHDAKNMRRLTGLRNAGKQMKVTKMKVTPRREKQEATRSATSSEWSWEGDSFEGMLDHDVWS